MLLLVYYKSHTHSLSYQGNGCLRVYDMEAKCFESDLKIVDSRRRKIVRVSCLLLVDFHVWVGCLGRTIHILDVETLCCEFNEH